MVLTRVVFPEPFSPTKKVRDFLGTQHVASQRISFESRTTVRSQHSTMFSVGLLIIDVIYLLFVALGLVVVVVCFNQVLDIVTKKSLIRVTTIYST